MTQAKRSPTRAHVPLVLVVLGLLLIAASFASFSALSKREWTIADSEAFSQVTREMHAETMAPRGDSTAANRYQEQLAREYERLSTKLAAAQAAPRRWSRLFLWTGAGLATAGALIHLSRRSG